MTALAIPRAFLWKRIHSLAGLWMVVFLAEHLLTNSQAALWWGDRGASFVHMVNALHNLPYLPFIEGFLLGVPMAVHAAFGIRYALRGKGNVKKSDGRTPSLPEYGRNKAYSLQRITSWILLFGLLFHVVEFRFLDYPVSVRTDSGKSYFITLPFDRETESLSKKLGVTLYDSDALIRKKQIIQQKKRTVTGTLTSAEAKAEYESLQKWMDTVEKIPLREGKVVAESSNFGTITLLSVRQTFFNPWYRIGYTLFVLAACFHAFNGLWSFFVTWGLVIRLVMQRSLYTLALVIMGLVSCLGLAAVWGG